MTTADRERSCADRITEQQAGREHQFAAYFGDLDAMDETDLVNLAREYVDDFDLTPYEQMIADSAEQPPDLIVNDAEGDPSTVGDEWDKIVERAKEALETFREDGPHDAVLGVGSTVTVTLRVELSTGGPGDFVTCEIDPEDRSISDVTYHFQDWFDGATKSVDDDSPLHDLCTYYAEIVDLDLGSGRF